MIKYLFIIAILLFSLSSRAQFKLQSNGEVRLWTNNMNQWDNTFVTYANNDNSKCYIVDRNGNKFYVRGDGNVYSNGYYSISDSTQKENVIRIDNAIEKLLRLEGVTYNFIKDNKGEVNTSSNHNHLPDSSEKVIDNTNNSENKKEMGLIAQQVQQIIPEAVDTFEGGNLALSYDALVGLLIEAVKEQQLQIETLQASVFLQKQDIISINEISENCCLNENNKSKLKSASINNSETSKNETLSGKATLLENIPNPFSLNSVIKFEIPEYSTSAKLIIHDMQGMELKSFNITQKGAGSITINGFEFNAGMYLYTLLIDNKIIDTKRMLLTKE